MSDGVRLVRSDLPAKNRKAILGAVQLFYAKHVKKGDAKKPKTAKWSDFALELKQTLDGNVGPHWHVLVGAKLGFACKKRNQTSAIFRVEEVMIIIYQSPGLEEPEPAEPPTAKETEGNGEAKDADAAKADEGDATPGGAPGAASATLKVLEPSTVEAGSGEEQVVNVLKEEFCGPSEDMQEVAQAVRRRLTDELGTIWHVVVGQEFVHHVAEDRRNYVVATAGKKRIICFQHEQFSPQRVNWEKLMKAIPYLFLAVFCMIYMTMNSLCGDEIAPDRKIALKFKDKFCQGDWESRVNVLGLCALASLFLTRKMKWISDRKAEKATERNLKGGAQNLAEKKRA